MWCIAVFWQWFFASGRNRHRHDLFWRRDLCGPAAKIIPDALVRVSAAGHHIMVICQLSYMSCVMCYELEVMTAFPFAAFPAGMAMAAEQVVLIPVRQLQ